MPWRLFAFLSVLASLFRIGDAFRAAGYTPDQLNAYTTIVEKRIAELNQL